jgi:restriction endonuclease Mrr
VFGLWKTQQVCYERLNYLYDLRCFYQAARDRYDGLLAIVKSRRYQLLHKDWRALRGNNFEGFLQDVFEMLGFNVETTKASGDQGIDLILTGKGRRIGVQAKGYAENVGNHAVMEAHAGKDFYGCDSCVVVTNSDFTRTAQELAARSNCQMLWMTAWSGSVGLLHPIDKPHPGNHLR